MSDDLAAEAGITRPKKKGTMGDKLNQEPPSMKETRGYLATVPNRFEFTFTPKHGSWLNIIECFFSKMTRSVLRGIRVSSKKELKERILQYFHDLNQNPKIFRWSYKLDEIG